MIEINLVPDVKQELIRAQRVRNSVISLATLFSIVAVIVVVVLSLYVFGAQALRGTLADNSIKSNEAKLKNVKDLPNALTIQNQLSQISSNHDQTVMTSRIFDILSVVVPSSVTVTNFTLDSTQNQLTIDGETTVGYQALETLKKTIVATNFQYTSDGHQQTVPLSTQITDGTRSYSQDANGQQTLNFSIVVTYSPDVFARTSISGRVVGPSVTNATDSAQAVPQSLFSQNGGGN